MVDSKISIDIHMGLWYFLPV